MGEGLDRRMARASESVGWRLHRLRHSRPVRRAARMVRDGAKRPPLTQEAPEPFTGAWPLSVLTIGERSLPQCYHYRIRQKAYLMHGLDVPYTELPLDDVDEARSRLQLARILIVYRLPYDRRIAALVTEARRLGIPVVFEVDDAVYRRDLVAANPNLESLSWALRSATIRGADDYVRMAMQADAHIGSNEAIATDLQRITGKPALVLENGIDEQMLEIAASLDAEPKPADGAPVVIYGSGSLAHDRDFEVAATGLGSWLSRDAKRQLLLVGSVTVPPVLQRHSGQIRILPQLSFPEYLRALRRSTVALAPLTVDPFNHYKSHIRYLESGLVGTPLIASPTLYGEYVQDGATGLIAEDGQWYEALERLTSDAALRDRLARNARSDVRQWELDQRPRRQFQALLQALAPDPVAV